MRYLKQFDQFSARYNPFIDNNDIEYKTIIGAISSIVIYILSLSYLIYQLYQWQTNQFLPTIVISNQILTDSLQSVNNSIVINFDPEQKMFDFDIFDNKNNYLHPTINPYCNGKICNDKSEIHYQISKNKYEISNLNISNALDDSIINEYYLEFNMCNDSIANNSIIKCAKQEDIDNYLNTKPWILLKLNFSQFNIHTKQIEYFRKQYWLYLSKNATYTQINLKSGFINVEDGFLTTNQKSYHILNSAEINTVTGTLDANLIGLDFYLDSLVYKEEIQYPLLDSVLANTGSIISLLFTLSFFVQRFNQIQLKKYLVNEIISFYYPQFKKIRITRKLCKKGKVKVQSYDLNVDYQPDKILQIYKEAEKIAIKKLGILNILYELSRIQFILQSIQGRDMILKSRQIGIKLPLEIVQKEIQKILPIQQTQLYSKEQQIFIQSKNQNKEIGIIYQIKQIYQGNENDQSGQLIQYELVNHRSNLDKDNSNIQQAKNLQKEEEEDSSIQKRPNTQQDKHLILNEQDFLIKKKLGFKFIQMINLRYQTTIKILNR